MHRIHAAGKKAKDFKPIIDQAAAVEILNIWLEQTMPPPEFPDFI
jgi:putative Holliday junction resolvase